MHAAQATAATPQPLTASETRFVDGAVSSIIRRYDVPGASIAIVRDGRIVYAKAYGYATLPDTGAVAGTRFAIGSITKQLTAAAILLLVQRGKLKLDDPVAKFMPDLGHANEVTVRELLEHTSGYVDYLSEEYPTASVERPTTVDAILRTSGQLPLAFRPGTRWEYSGTNYVIAGSIVQRVSGSSYEADDATFVDEAGPGSDDATGYYRFGLGPPRISPRAGAYWLYAMADIGMTASDVARWDCAFINRNVLSGKMVDAMMTEGRTTSGQPTGYGLGVFLSKVYDDAGKPHTMVSHPGEIFGFRSDNWVIPDLKTALVVLTNAEYSSAASDVGIALRGVLAVASPAPTAPKTPAEARVQSILIGLAGGRIDRSQLTPDASAVFNGGALDDLRYGLAGAGALRDVRLVGTQYRGGLTHYTFDADYELRTLQVDEYVLPDGKIAEFFLDDG